MTKNKTISKLDPRSPWQIQEQNKPQTGSFTDQMMFLLRYAILAPSGHNIQPWKFLIKENEIQVFADKTRWAKAIDPDQRELHIGLGCALENLLIASEHFGYRYDVVYFTKPKDHNLIASIKFTRKKQLPSFREAKLFNAIIARHTNRKEYDGHAISANDLNFLQKCCIEKGVRIDIIDRVEIKKKIKNLLIRGHNMTVLNSAFLTETVYWMKDGLFNIPKPMIQIIQKMIPIINKIGKPALKPLINNMDSKLVMSSSALAIISANEDNKKSQIIVGQVFERLALMATALGISTHPMSPIVGIPELRSEILKLLPDKNVVPLQAFRLGYAEKVKNPTPRRPLEEVLIYTK